MSRLDRSECRLRPLEEADLATVLAWRNSARVRCNMLDDHVIARDEHLHWFARVAQRATDCYSVFEWRAEPWGVVGFSRIDRAASSAFWSFFIGPDGAPRGLGAAMCVLGIEDFFASCDIDRVSADVIEFNRPSLRLHERLGFTKVEGAAGPVERDGRRWAVRRLELTRTAWRAVRAAQLARCFGPEC